MITLIIDKKKYVLLEQKTIEKLQLLAAGKSTPAKKMTLAKGKKLAYNLIDQWAKRK